ncbi:MAG: UDP-N-acetylmuramoyl-tripeptide--D-alanyl-D-alanine ligase [Dorea sp.]|nr:UDP-N-acetylmuramoyl-tripeptide--D-alanyl-D-alanine ligase [Dorea sp.]
MKNLTLNNITRAVGGTYHGDSSLLEKEVTNVVIDSRKVEPGDLFIAIDGARVNAHKFIPDVVAKGALCVICHEDPGETDYNYILVKSTGQALLDTAKLYRDIINPKVVGVTGSVGKTSTKEMIASVLAQKFKVHKTLGNFNNEWGLPITIFAMPEDTEVAILEMGVNHFGEMRRLSSVANPDICVITNIGVAHLEFFKTREGILKEKSSMIQDMKNGGTILLNGDDDLLSTIGETKGSVPFFFGLGAENAVFADHVEALGLRGSSCQIHLPDGSSFDCIVPIPGIHMVINALAGTSAGLSLGLTAEEIKAGIEGLPSIPGRNHIIKTDKMIILDDCYNANPISMKASLDILNIAIGRKVAILGDMGELGEDASTMHQSVGEYAAELGMDVVIGVGPISKAIQTGAAKNPETCALWFETKADLLTELGTIIKEGDNVLVKASHGMHFPEIVEALEKM